MKHPIVIDLGYGDGGKGTTVDFLARHHQAELVVRFNGGPQSSHHVVLPGGSWHGFSQFGAGTFVGAKTYLSQYVLFEPWAFLNELDALSRHLPFQELLEMHSVHADCAVITPWHWKLNRAREIARGESRHGSCGMGIGELRSDELAGREVVRVSDLAHCTAALQRIRERLVMEARTFSSYAADDMLTDTIADVADFYRAVSRRLNIVQQAPAVTGPVIFEGAQGVLIDEVYGWEPYRTWTDCTHLNALSVASEMDIETETVGVVSAVAVRHGAGPFVSEFSADPMMEAHNAPNYWQGRTRHGFLDILATRYAIKHARTDVLMLTRADVAAFPLTACFGYKLDGVIHRILPDFWSANQLFKSSPVVGQVENVAALEEILNRPIRYLSTGPTFADKEIRTL